MSIHPLAALFSLLGLGAAALVAGNGQLDTVRLTPPPTPEVGGWVRDQVLVPGGDLVLFRAGHPFLVEAPLYIVAIDGSSSPVLLAERVSDSYVVSPDGSAVYYLRSFTQGLDFQLFRVPTDGGSPPERMPLPDDGGRTVKFVLSPDGAMLACLRNQTDTIDPGDVYVLPSDGMTPATLLEVENLRQMVFTPDSSRLVVAGAPGTFVADVSAPSPLIALEPGQAGDFHFTPDSQRVVYTFGFALKSATLDGAMPIRLDFPSVASSSVEQLRITPDARVVFRGVQENAGYSELFSVRADGTQSPLKLNPLLVAGGDIDHFELTPDGSTVVYRADEETDERFELFRLALGVPGVSSKLSGALIGTGDVEDFQLASTGACVVYRADADVDEVLELFGVPLGGGPANQLNSDGVEIHEYRIAPSGLCVVALGELLAGTAAGSFQLRSAPIDGSQGSILLSPLLSPSISVPAFLAEFETTSNELLYFTDEGDEFVVRLFAVPLDGSAPPLTISGNPSPIYNGGSTLHVASKDALWVVFRWFDELLGKSTDGVGETVSYGMDASAITIEGDRVFFEKLAEPGLFSSPLDGSSPTTCLIEADVASYSVIDDGLRVIVSSCGELFSVPSNGTLPAQPVRPLGSQGVVSEYLLTRDEQRVIYRADQDTPGIRQLYVTPLDGTGPSVSLHPSMIEIGAVLAGDDDGVLYRVDGGPDVELYYTNLKGVPTPELLNAPTATGTSVSYFEANAAATHAIYMGNQDDVLRDELYSVPLGGSSPPIKLNPPLNPAVRVSQARILPDGMSVIFRTGGAERNLHVVPIDGSTPAQLLASATDPDWKFEASSQRLFYRSGQILYSVPIDSSSGPFMQAPAPVLDFQFGTAHHYVFMTNRVGFGVEVFRARLDGTGAHELMTPGTLPGVNVADTYTLSPDEERLIYRTRGFATGVPNNQVFSSSFQKHRRSRDLPRNGGTSNAGG